MVLFRSSSLFFHQHQQFLVSTYLFFEFHFGAFIQILNSPPVVQRKIIKMPIHFDRTLTPSMDARRRMKIIKQFQELRGKTHFDDYELKCMLLMFLKMAPKGVLKKSAFFVSLRSMMSLIEEPILERLYCTLEAPREHGITYDQWICLISLYCRGSFEEKVAFTFMVFDIMGTGTITRETVYELLMNQLGLQYKNVNEEENMIYMNKVFTILDKDKDNVVSWQDFRDVVTESPPLIHCLGRVIPERNVVDAFLTTFTTKIGPQYTAKSVQKQAFKKRVVEKLEPSAL